MLLKITALTANTAVSINMLLITASTHEQIQTKSVNLQKHPETSDTVCAPSVGARHPENHRHHTSRTISINVEMIKGALQISSVHVSLKHHHLHSVLLYMHPIPRKYVEVE